MEDSAKVRLVRCPKCQKLLPELADYSVYQCGGCGAVLRAKNKGYGSCSLSETSDEGEIQRDPVKPENSLGKGVSNLSDDSDVDVDSNDGSSLYGQRDLEKARNGHESFLKQSDDDHEKRHLRNDLDVDTNKDEGDSKSIGREQEEHKPQMGYEKGSKFSARISNWRIKERDEMEAFWRKPSVDMEGVRFSTLNYPDEGTSNSDSSFSNNYGEQWDKDKDMDGVRRVQHLEQDRAELLRKLDELTNQLIKSAELASNPKEQVHSDGRSVPPDPYSGSDAWFSDGSSELNRTARQFFGPNKHMAGPPYVNYHHDPYAYTSGHEMAMRNFHPLIHNQNYVPGYGDPFASQMSRGPTLNQLSYPFPQQPMHPYFPGQYADTGPNSYEPYAHNPMLHPPSCSCFLCSANKRRGSVPAPPVAFVNNSIFPDTPNDPMLYSHKIPGPVSPHLNSARTAVPSPSLHGNQLHTRPSDFNSEMGGFVRSRPRKVMPASSRHCLPIAGGSPFITCYNCFELLQLPIKALVKMKRRRQKLRCGACSSGISIAVINKKLVVSPHSEMKETVIKETMETTDDRPNEVVNSSVSHAHGDVNSSGVNFSSDDYANYDFHSVDRESPVLTAEPRLNSSKLQEMQSFHSSLISASEDENSPEVVIPRGEVTKSIHQPTRSSKSPPPFSVPLQEHFDRSDNNLAINRFGKGNQSSRSEQEKGKIDKVTSRQNSLREVVLATEMDVHDYSNSGTSQDCGDSSQEHDRSKSNKRSESFFANFIKKGFRDSSQSSRTDDGGDSGESKVTVNGQLLPDHVIKKAEKLAGPIRPGNYWYDSRAGFWGVMGGPCLGIIPPFIEEFNFPMPEKCAGGNTGIYVNGRELHQRDLDLLSGRGLPRDNDRYYIIEISGRVLDEDTGEELDSLGKLAPTVEKARHGFGMKEPRTASK